MPLTPRAEPDTGRGSHLGLTDQEGAELERVEVSVRLRDRGPHEHRPLRPAHLPPDRGEAVAQCVTTALIDVSHVLGKLRGLVEGHRGRDLDRLERAIVEIALELRQGGHDLGVADQEGHPPASHGERLRHGVELNAPVLGSGDLENRRRVVPVEADIGVGVVVDDDQIPLGRERDDLLEERGIDTDRRRVVRERDDEHPRLGPAVLPGPLQVGDELVPLGQGNLTDGSASEDGSPDMDRVGGCGNEAGIARLEQDPHEMGEALLGPDDVQHLGLRIEVDPEPSQIEVGHRLTQLGDPLAG